MNSRMLRAIAGAVVVLAAFTLAACQYPSGGVTGPVDNTGTIKGTVMLGDGLNGSVEFARVAIYRNQINLDRRSPCEITEVDASGDFVFTDLKCQGYFIDAWKDNDGDRVITTGDFYYMLTDGNSCACPLNLQVGQVANVNAVMKALP